MHEAKIETYIPMVNGDDAIEIMADTFGCQLNVMIDGMCAYRLNISRELVLTLKDHSSDASLFKMNLQNHYNHYNKED